MQPTITKTFTPAKVLAILIALAVAMTVALAPAPAYAASKTVGSAKFTTATKTINKKAATVKKGTTKLTFKKGHGFLKFKATATKKYKFTFSGLKGTSNAFAEPMLTSKDSPKYTFIENIATKGGKCDALWISGDGAKFDYGDMKSRPIATRTGTIKLKKGTFFYFYFSAGSGKATVNLKIK